MPTYDYRCSSCGARLELVHSIHGGPPETCPSCGAKDTLRKAFAPPTIVFKGSGWAKKERTSKARAAAKAGDAAKSGDGADAGSSTDGGGKGAPGKADPGSGAGDAKTSAEAAGS
jgi:putative FmdB family regulatory protein